MFNEMMRELKDMRYVPQLKKILFQLDLWRHRVYSFLVETVLKMHKSSMVVSKGVRNSNLYYLKDNTIIGQLATSVGSNDDSTRL